MRIWIGMLLITMSCIGYALPAKPHIRHIGPDGKPVSNHQFYAADMECRQQIFALYPELYLSAVVHSHQEDFKKANFLRYKCIRWMLWQKSTR